MFTRNKILVLTMLLVLGAPAAGWAKATEIDPDGQPLASPGVEARWESSLTTSDTYLEVTASVSTGWTGEATGMDSLFERFFRWLQALVLPL